MNKRAVEQTGLIPRSIIRTFERFLKQLLPGAEMLVIQEFRISRYQVIVSVRCFLTLFLVPIIVNIFSKTFLITPLVEFIWNQDSNEIFLNSYQQKRALKELYFFEDKIYFESLLNIETSQKNDKINIPVFSFPFLEKEPTVFLENENENKNGNEKENQTLGQPVDHIIAQSTILNETLSLDSPNAQNFDTSLTNARAFGAFAASTNVRGTQITNATPFGTQVANAAAFGTQVVNATNLGKNYQNKILEIATTFNKESIESISNLFADFFSFFSFSLVFVLMKPQIIILKSFLAESLYSLSDTTKSFLLILGTDLLVGFHSPHGWEVFLEGFLRHLGLPENVEFMSLFVATFPVFLDTVFKYWIFRSLNKISPSTVATYHNMIE
mgnify:CR=1 FL=1